MLANTVTSGTTGTESIPTKNKKDTQSYAGKSDGNTVAWLLVSSPNGSRQYLMSQDLFLNERTEQQLLTVFYLMLVLVSIQNRSLSLWHFNMHITELCPIHCPTSVCSPPNCQSTFLCVCVFQQTQGKQCGHGKACRSFSLPTSTHTLDLSLCGQ